MFSSVLVALISTSLCSALVIPSQLETRSAASIITYPTIPLFANSTVFGVTANSVHIDVPVAATYHTSAFSATSGLVTIVVTSLKGPINMYTLEPAGPDVGSAVANGNTLTFTVQAPRKVEVRINSAVTYIGDTAASTVMYLIVDKPEIAAQIPSRTDPKVLYFGPGVHNLGLMLYNATNPPPSQIYAAPGALVNAAWRFVGVAGVTISGRGFLRNPFQDKSQNMIYFSGSQIVVIKDVFVIDSPQHVIAISSGSVGNAISSHFNIDNIKSLHRGGNSDGFSLFGPCNHIVVQNVLLVNMDNQIVLQAGLPTGPYSNVFKNNIFVKPNSAANFMAIYTPPTAFGRNDVVNGTIGANNLFQNFDILRLSGENGLIMFDGANKVDNIQLDQFRVVTWNSRNGNTANNYFLQLSSNDTAFAKSISITNSSFPAFPTTGFGGSLINGNWKVRFNNVSFGGAAMSQESQIGLTPTNKGARATILYA